MPASRLQWRSILRAATLAVAVSACATPTPPSELPAAPAPVAPAPRMPAVTAPKIDDWLAERQRIVDALAGRADLSATIAGDGTLRILIPGADAFGRDDAQPRSALKTTLDRIAAALALRAETEIFVVGHTDSMGSELHNLQLSIRRAEAVVEHLRTQGIALTRLHADGRGEAEPVADNGDEAGRARNRRVEILVRPFR